MIGENVEVVDLKPSQETDRLRVALLNVGQDGDDEPRILEWIRDAIYDIAQAMGAVTWNVLIQMGGLPVDVDDLIRQVQKLPTLVGDALADAICSIYAAMVNFYRYVGNLVVGNESLMRTVEIVRRQFERCKDIIQSIPSLALSLLAKAVGLILTPARILSTLIGTAATNVSHLLAKTTDRIWDQASKNEVVLVAAERLIQVGFMAIASSSIISDNALTPIMETYDKFLMRVATELSVHLRNAAQGIKAMVETTGVADLVRTVAESIQTGPLWNSVFATIEWFRTTNLWTVLASAVQWMMSAASFVQSKLSEFVLYLSTAFGHWAMKIANYLLPWDSGYYPAVPVHVIYWLEKNLITGPAGKGVWNEDLRGKLRESGARLRELIEETADRRLEKLRKIRGWHNMLDSLEYALRFSLPVSRGLVRGTWTSVTQEDLARLEEISGYKIRGEDPATAEARNYLRLFHEITTEPDDYPEEEEEEEEEEEAPLRVGNGPTLRKRAGRSVQRLAAEKAVLKRQAEERTKRKELRQAAEREVLEQQAEEKRKEEVLKQAEERKKEVLKQAEEEEENVLVTVAGQGASDAGPGFFVSRSRISESVGRYLAMGGRLTSETFANQVQAATVRFEAIAEREDNRKRKMLTDPIFREHQREKASWGAKMGFLILGAYSLTFIWSAYFAERGRQEATQVRIADWYRRQTEMEEGWWATLTKRRTKDARGEGEALSVDLFSRVREDTGGPSTEPQRRFFGLVPDQALAPADVNLWASVKAVNYFTTMEGISLKDMRNLGVVKLYERLTGEVVTDENRAESRNNIRTVVLHGAKSLQEALAHPKSMNWLEAFDNYTIRTAMVWLTGGGSELAIWTNQVVGYMIATASQLMPLVWLYSIGHLIGSMVYAAFVEKPEDIREEIMANTIKLLFKDFFGWAMGVGMFIQAGAQVSAGSFAAATLAAGASVMALGSASGGVSMLSKIALIL